MGDTEADQKQQVLAPSRDQQHTQPTVQPSTPQELEESQEEKLQQARKFLQDANVQNTTPERKVEFLKSKGLSESDIEGLLKEVTRDGASSTQATVRLQPVLLSPALL